MGKTSLAAAPETRFYTLYSSTPFQGHGAKFLFGNSNGFDFCSLTTHDELTLYWHS